jgi:putative membrane protein (TIGR04086 family)
MAQPVRSILAVIAGYLAMAIVVVVLTVVTVAVLHLQSGHPTALYLALNVVYSLGAAVLGGWVAGRIARRSPVAHGVALGVLMLALSAYQLKHPAPGQPFAYLIVLLIACPLAAIAGAALNGRS